MKLPNFPAGSVVNNLPANTGDAGSILGSERSPGEGNSNPLQHSCLENMDRGAWRATVHGVAKSQTPLSNSHTPINYEMTMIQYPGHISQTAQQ